MYAQCRSAADVTRQRLTDALGAMSQARRADDAYRR
jgi:hypothetical protein